MYSNGRVIGKNYENALDQVKNPGMGTDGADGYFIPDATGSMDCATLKTNFDKLDNQIQYWYGVLQGGDNSSAELQNLNLIINLQKTKKDYYATLMLRNCSTVTDTTDPGTPNPYEDQPAPDGAENKGGIMTFITANPLAAAAIAVALIIALTHFNKKPQRKRRKAA
jgi:hypothetical protein